MESMKTAGRTIDHLDKVELKLTISPSPGQSAPEVKPLVTSLIFGIGVEGLTPFENLLFGKPVGHQLALSVQGCCGDSIFGHLGRPIFQQIPLNPPFNLEVTVLSIERAEGREVVKAMASMAEGCDGGCNCGCGC